MKKAIVMLTLAITMVSGVSMAAQVYPKYLNGDSNYILTNYRMDVGRYLQTTASKIVEQSSTRITLKGHLASAKMFDGERLIQNPQIQQWDVMYRRYYNDPWNVVYLYNERKSEWIQIDLSNTAGYNLNSVINFANIWYYATGTVYPNLERYIRY